MAANHEADTEDDLKRKLVRRVAFAGVLIAMLLGALAFVDYLGRSGDEAVGTGPVFTEPVPVARKEVTQPVTPAMPEPPVAIPPAEPYAASPQEPVTMAAPAADVPAGPEIAARPALPARTSPSGASRAAGQPVAAEPEETSAATVAPPVASPPVAPAVPAAETPPPAPPRLLSGYAVQAGVFADAQHAEELRAKLTLNGIPSTLEARVQVGPFKTRAEAEAARRKLKGLGIDGILLPPRGRR